jgi:hypothetical protein
MSPSSLHRSLLALAAALLLLGPASARASETFPPVIRSELGLASEPQCILCHRDNDGGFGTVIQPFGRSMVSRGLDPVVPDALGTLRRALQALEAEGIDSDGDGTPDIAELRAGQDPNSGGAALAQQAPEFGCSAAGALAPWVAPLVLLLRVERRRRRGR